MAREPLTVYVVDDDDAVLRALGRLLSSAGLHAKLFASIPALLAVQHPAPRSCVVAEVGLSGAGEPNLAELLRDRGWTLPVIFLTGANEGGFRAEARRAGAAAFFHKPIDDQALIDAIEWAAGNGA